MKLMIIGASSAIAEAIAQLYCAHGDDILLVGRDGSKIQAIADDLATRGSGKIETSVMDALEYENHGKLIGEAQQKLGGLDLALIAHGTLPDQAACEQDFNVARQEIEINCLSVISMLTHLANHFESQQKGTLVVISSVAGDRGRQSNYIYGTAKGAVSIFLQGLRNRLYRSNVKVITVKPGFVDTPMTRDFDKGLLWATPDQVARQLYRAIRSGKENIYTPWFWRYIMLIIRLIPERIFKKLKL